MLTCPHWEDCPKTYVQGKLQVSGLAVSEVKRGCHRHISPAIAPAHHLNRDAVAARLQQLRHFKFGLRNQRTHIKAS